MSANQPINMEYQRTEILLSGERATFLSFFFFNVWDNLYVTFQTFLPHPKQFKHVETADQEASCQKKPKKYYETCHFP